MDCAPFIRTRWTLTAWIVVPILLLISIGMAAHGFYSQQRISFEQKQAMSRMVPEMERAKDAALFFLADLRFQDHEIESAREVYIDLINTAALESEFTLETIYLDQKTLDYELKTAQVAINLVGSGSTRQIAVFLKQIKDQDPTLCVNELLITPGNTAPGMLRVEAEFIKTYAEAATL